MKKVILFLIAFSFMNAGFAVDKSELKENGKIILNNSQIIYKTAYDLYSEANLIFKLAKENNYKDFQYKNFKVISDLSSDKTICFITLLKNGKKYSYISVFNDKISSIKNNYSKHKSNSYLFVDNSLSSVSIGDKYTKKRSYTDEEYNFIDNKLSSYYTKVFYSDKKYTKKEIYNFYEDKLSSYEKNYKSTIKKVIEL